MQEKNKTESIWDLNSQVSKMKKNSSCAFMQIIGNKINFHKDPQMTEHRYSR